MRWSTFHQQFQDKIMPKEQIKGLDVLYVISHRRNKQPYKIGITETNIYSRLQSYQTAFIDFEIYYLIALPDKGARSLEKILHDRVPNRINFPSKKKETSMRMSEWFDTRISNIAAKIQEAVKLNNIRTYFSYDLRYDDISPWKVGTFKIMKKSNGVYDKYLGMVVKSNENEKDIGIVIDVPDTNHKRSSNKAVVKWSENEIYPLEVSDIERYASEFGIQRATHKLREQYNV